MTPPRIALLAPGLRWGGRDLWNTALALGLGAHGVEVAGIGVLRPERIAREFRARLEGRCRIAEGQDACRALVASSDLVVLSGDIGAVPDLGKPAVFVSHGQSAQARVIATAWAPQVVHWAAVSPNATVGLPLGATGPVIPNGLDVDRCEAGRERSVVRQAWGVADGECVVAYLGRLAAEKNVGILVECMKRLSLDHERTYQLVVYGAAEEDVIEALRWQCRTLPVRAICRYPVMEVGEVYRAADCVVCPSDGECWSLVPAEAWYCGCPVVTTPTGVMLDLQEEFGELAAVVPVQPTPHQVADGIRYALSPDFRPSVTRARGVARRFTAERMCGTWAQFILRCSESNSTSPTGVTSGA